MTFEIPDDITSEDREVLEEILAHPDIFSISDVGMVRLVDPEAAKQIPGVQKALKQLQQHDRHLFTLTAELDSEWFLKPLVDCAIEIWEKDRRVIEELYDHVMNHEWEETLKHFMREAQNRWDTGPRPAKLLYDVQQVMKNQTDFGITEKREDESGLIVSSIYEGLTQDENCSNKIVAIVYYEGGLEEVFYGDDPHKMRKQIKRMYHNNHGCEPDKLILNRRI